MTEISAGQCYLIRIPKIVSLFLLSVWQFTPLSYPERQTKQNPFTNTRNGMLTLSSSLLADKSKTHPSLPIQSVGSSQTIECKRDNKFSNTFQNIAPIPQCHEIYPKSCMSRKCVHPGGQVHSEVLWAPRIRLHTTENSGGHGAPQRALSLEGRMGLD